MINYSFIQRWFFCVVAFVSFSCDEKEDRVTKLTERVERAEKKIGRLQADTSSQLSVHVVRVPLAEDTTGNEVCTDQQKACLGVIYRTGSLMVDPQGEACGFAVADCNSRVIPQRCGKGSPYTIAPVRFRRTPGMKGDCGAANYLTCASDPGSLEAICVY